MRWKQVLFIASACAFFAGIYVTSFSEAGAWISIISGASVLYHARAVAASL